MKTLQTSFSFLFLLLANFLAGQTHTISGYIKDGENGEELLGATVFIEETKTGTVTNAYGYYSLSLPAGTYNLRYSYIGYSDIKQTVKLTADIKKNIRMQIASEELKEVVVASEALDRNVTSSEMSTTKLDIRQIKSVPVLFGEQDILKTIQLMPGVKSAGEGSSGFFVRGGSADQNLILLDGAPVYNASHLLGFFSVFNSDAIKDAKLYKGGMPADYGGRLSSVLDIRMKEGNSQRFAAKGGIGTISSRLSVEGPIMKDKSSFLLSGRRTYADMFLKLSSDETLNSNKLYFYDFNGKANYWINDNNRVFLSGYFGRDRFVFQDIFGIDWGNQTLSARWNHTFNNKLFMNFTGIYSNYDYAINLNWGDEFMKIGSSIEDIIGKLDMQYFLSQKSNLHFGVSGTHHTFNPGFIETEGSAFDGKKLDLKYVFESNAYVSNEHKITDRLNATYGLRFANFSVIGPQTVFNYEYSGGPYTEETYGKGEVIKSYNRLEPRLAASYKLAPTISMKASYAKNSQFLHLITSSSGASPTDYWLPSSANITYQTSDQVAGGVFKNFLDNMFETSIELYYKDMQNSIETRSGADIYVNEHIDTLMIFGKGFSYGAEFFIRKQLGKLTGWIGYTLSKTEQNFDEINEGKWFSVRHDRRHDISLVAVYNISKKVQLGASWVYNTGDWITMQKGIYEINGMEIPYYNVRNSDKMEDYHRMDLSCTINFEKRKLAGLPFKSSLNISVYNVYNRKNPYFYQFEKDEDSGDKALMKYYLFPVLPSVTWNFEF